MTAGSSGSSPSARRAWRSSSSTPVLDVGPVITVPRWCTTAFVTELLTQAPTCSDHDHTPRSPRSYSRPTSTSRSRRFKWKAILDTRVLIAEDLGAAPTPLVLAQVEC
jgi:hypothetical protein